MYNETVIKFENEDRCCSLFFEDNGRVAYAYLIKDDEVIADVWLYNYGRPPTVPEWHDRNKMPFKNPLPYVEEAIFPPVKKEADIAVQWIESSQGTKIAQVIIRNEVHAYLRPGAKPGWSKLAVKDSPLAKTIDSFELESDEYK